MLVSLRLLNECHKSENVMIAHCCAVKFIVFEQSGTKWFQLGNIFALCKHMFCCAASHSNVVWIADIDLFQLLWLLVPKGKEHKYNTKISLLICC